MKRTLMLMAGVMALGCAIYASNKIWAQAPNPNPAPAPAQLKTKIGLVNLQQVIKEYNKFKTFSEELKNSVAPFQGKDTALKTEGDKLAKEGQSPQTTAQRRDEIERRLKDIQRQLEDNKVEAQKIVGKKQEDQLKILYADIRTVVDRFAQAHGYEMVLHYNDAVTAEEYWSAQNIARKLQAGALMPMYISNGLDITRNIIATLNAGAPAAPAAGGAAAAQPPRR
ncbi:MAG: OmpH family outer membrane protein [Gemmataceae bacterium]